MQKYLIKILIGFSLLPIILILVFIFVIYLPKKGQKPEYNFIFKTSTGDIFNYTYEVYNKRIVRNENKNIQNLNFIFIGREKLFIYNVTQNTSTEISLQESQKYTVNTNKISPDGYEFVTGQFGKDMAFFDFQNIGLYLTGHNHSYKLAMEGYLFNKVKFLGWTEK